MTSSETKELYYLLNKLCENVISDEEFERLEILLNSDQQACEIYLDFVSLWSNLRFFQVSGHSSNGASSHIRDSIDSPSQLSDSGIWQALLKDEKEIPATELITTPEPEHKIKFKSVEKTNIIPNRFFRVYNAVITAAAVLMILFIAYTNIFPPQLSEEVATVTDIMQVAWSPSSSELTPGDRVYTNQLPYVLDKGIIELSYDEGVDLVVEGPAKFTISKKGIDVAYGNLYSYVSQNGRGFWVNTPNNRFIDHGTEFGVLVDENATAELHVLKGEVQYYSGLPGAVKSSKLIRQNEARRFDGKTGDILPIPVESEYFVRHIDSGTGLVWRGKEKIDLVRILSGKDKALKAGDSIGINPYTGEYVSIDYNKTVSSKGEYTSFDDTDFIDGVFIPDGGNGPVKISSKGDLFNCPDTSGGFTQNIALFKGGVARDNENISTAIFNGKNIEQQPESFICMHSNCGITIDLQAVINTMPGNSFASFRAWGGITEYVDGISGRPADIDFWVLVDGEIKYKRELLKVKDGVIEFNIDLNKENRFLTFIVTDGFRETDTGKDTWANDFFYMVNPSLQIVQN